LDDFTTDLDTCHCRVTLAAHDTGDLSMPQFGSLRLRRPHHHRGESFRMDLCRCCRRAQLLVHGYTSRQPIEPMDFAAIAQPGGAAISGEAAIAAVAADLRRKPSVQCKAAACQRFQRRAVAPVQGEEAACLP
jgi:hypothetical protein